jgi:hypothetical protein
MNGIFKTALALWQKIESKTKSAMKKISKKFDEKL